MPTENGPAAILAVRPFELRKRVQRVTNRVQNNCESPCKTTVTWPHTRSTAMTRPIPRTWQVMAATTLHVLAVACARQVAPVAELAGPAHLMTPQELSAVPHRVPDRRISYGEDSSQYGEVRVPASRGPHPVVILVHGGCFKAAYATAGYFGAMGDALKADG